MMRMEFGKRPLALLQSDIQFKFVNGNDWSGNGDGNVDN